MTKPRINFKTRTVRIVELEDGWKVVRGDGTEPTYPTGVDALAAIKAEDILAAENGVNTASIIEWETRTNCGHAVARVLAAK